MRIEFVQRENGPERLVCEAELVFDASDGVLDGLKLLGFCIWRSADGELRVTFPSKTYGAASGHRFFDLLRAQNGTPKPVKTLKAWMIEQFDHEQGRQQEARTLSTHLDRVASIVTKGV